MSTIKEYNKDEKTVLSENFKAHEFSCQGKGCCSKTKIDDKLVEHLQNIREHFGAPVTISSGYRCDKHNKNVGGSSGSYHTKGMAADIIVKGVKPAEVAKYAESIGVLGIGLYETSKDGYFVHVDTRTKKSFWHGQKQEYRSTFGATKEEPEEKEVIENSGKSSTNNNIDVPPADIPEKEKNETKVDSANDHNSAEAPEYIKTPEEAQNFFIKLLNHIIDFIVRFFRK